MAKRCQLSTGKNSKHLDYTFDDNNFEAHTREFVTATTAADTQQYMELFDIP